MFRFTTLKEAARAFSAINNDYEKHSRTARQIAETFFDSKQVTQRILATLWDDRNVAAPTTIEMAWDSIINVLRMKPTNATLIR